jgi:hypothetical protein
MRSCLSIATFLVVVSSVFAGDSLKKYQSKNGKFVVMVTNTDPSIERRHVETKWGPMPVTTEAFSRDSGISLSVTYTDYPDAFAKVDGTKLLQTVRDTMLKDCIKLDDELTETRTGNRFGLTFSAKMTEKYNLKAKLFWSGTRLYQVTAVAKPSDMTKATVLAFLEKFDLKN